MSLFIFATKSCTKDMRVKRAHNMDIKKIIHSEITGGVILLFCAVLALVLKNSALGGLYDDVLHTHIKIMVGDSFGFDQSFHHWINDGLMVIFFLYVGLEIKKEVIEGDLSSVRKASLPVIAALGGVITPALIYVFINYGEAALMRGWAIPTATDIAFAVGILALLGNRIPHSLRVLLLSLAIIDDLAAIVVIAVFYTDHLSFFALGLSGAAFAAGMVMNRAGVKKIAPYVLVGFVMWACVLESGVHATLAGVFLAICIPMHGRKRKEGEGVVSPRESISPVKLLQQSLHPWVGFVIMPVFALANAGVSLSGISFGNLADKVPLGIILGLFVGKQVGVFSFVWIADKVGLCLKPQDVSWLQLYGLAILCGIGFTMSLFIGTLAFTDPLLMTEVRIGVLCGSALSAALGYLLLRFAPTRH